MSNLLDLIDQVFKSDGVLEKLGGRSVDEQHQYAISVGKSILNPSKEDRLSLLQADTGIGKTFGYLVPVMIHVATTPAFCDKKFIISTYTRQLQKQIINEDVPFIHKVLIALGIVKRPSASIRIGKQGFFSASRTQNICTKIIAKNPSRTNEINSFLEVVEDICLHGSGMWSDYIEDYGDLPAGITTNDICLLQHQKNDQAAYRIHLEKAALSSIIITNHHSILNPNRTGLSSFDVEAVIVDEAHKLNSICSEMFYYRVSLKDLTASLNKVTQKNASFKPYTDSAINYISAIKEALEQHPKFNTIDFISTLNAPVLFNDQREIVGEISNLLKKIQGKLLTTLDIDHLDNKDAELLNTLENQSEAIQRWLNLTNNQYQVSAFGVSSIRKSLSLATLNVRGSSLFGHIIKNISDHVILTSATLANAQKNLSFSQVQNHLGLRNFEVLEQISLSPKHYANMRFVLTDKNIPSPVLGIEEDTVNFSPRWLENTVKMIKQAAQDNKPVLVLTVSHLESKLIASRLDSSLNFSVHTQGHSIKEYTNDFVAGKTQILITSAGWEGLSLRTTEGEQLIHNIVISRIPFTPPNLLFAYALEVVSKINPNLASYKKNIEWVEAIQEVVGKLKQGFGRGTRSPSDDVLIWIADSRMPHSRNDKNSVLLNAIPSRFLNNYLSACVFEQQKKAMFFI